MTAHASTMLPLDSRSSALTRCAPTSPRGLMCSSALRRCGLSILRRGRPSFASLAGFADRWDGQARAAGWSDLELYGLHRAAPGQICRRWARRSYWRVRHSAIAVSPDAILTRSAAGAMLRIHGFPLGPDAVPAWSLCGISDIRPPEHARADNRL